MNKLKLKSCIKPIFLLLALIAFQSCSVYKASSNEGVSVTDAMRCSTKGCFLSLGMDVVSNRIDDDNNLIETYRGKARKSGANYLRAAGHGALDVVTLGLWEVAGTPIEGAISNNLGYITAIATYPCKTDSGVIRDLEIYDAHGKKVEISVKRSRK